MRTIQKNIYKYDELSDTAKEKAREWYVRCDDGDVSAVYEDAARMGAFMGIDLRTRPVKLMGGGTRYDPCIYYSGFWSQGDGACFEGTYRYQKGGAKAVEKECGGQDKELIRIAQELQDVQRKNFYRLRASTAHRGHYQHSGCMSVSVEDCENQYRDLGDAEDTVTQLLRDFADWIYARLEADYDHKTDDTVVAEIIIANEYEFDEHGSIH